MFRTSMAIGLVGLVAACGDPLAELGKLKDVELSQTDPAAAALPSEAETARPGYFGTEAATSQAGTEGALPDAAATAQVAEPAAEAAKPRGLLSLLRPKDTDSDSASVQADIGAPLDATSLDQSATDATVQTAAPETAASAVTEAATETPSDAQVAAQAPVAVKEPAKGGGLFGLFRRKPVDAAADAAPLTTSNIGTDASDINAAAATSEAQINDAPADAATVQTASLGAPAEATQTDATPPRRGLFGRSAAKKKDAPRTGPDAQDVTFGTTLAYGLVARVCDAKGKKLGRKVQNAPARKGALYDSAPGAAGARTWYVTGFDDGCPRQLTAANVLLGSAKLYEQLHYGPAGAHLPTGATDKAYEGVKRKVCGARRGKPCGAKIGKMEKSTFFVSAYDTFGNSRRWSELLIHEGEIVAAAVKTNR